MAPLSWSQAGGAYLTKRHSGFLMRLSPEQARMIKATIERIFDPSAQVWLFGSRVDDQRRGGDVDLYVEARNPELLQELRCKIGLEEALDLHVDLIVRKPGKGKDHPIHHIAKSEGVRL